MKKPFVKKVLSKFYIVFILIFAAYLSFQLITMTNPDMHTEPAIIQTVYDEFTSTGFIVRNEVTVASPSDSDAYIRFDVKDGARVAGGGKIATLFSSPANLELSLEISRLNSVVDKHNQLLSRPGISTNEALEMDKKLLESVISISASSDTGDITKAANIKEELAFMLAGRDLMTGGNTGVLANRNEALKEKEAIEKKLSGKEKVISAPVSGAFVSHCDGYETILSAKDVENMTYEQVTELLSTEISPPQGMLGKIVHDYEWYFTCPATDAQMKGLETGKKYLIKFPFNAGKGIMATLKSIRTSAADKNLLIFSSFDVAPEINLLRTQTVQIVKNSFEGLRVNNQARRVKDNAVGVFVHSGMTIEFRTIEEIFSADTFVIAKLDDKSKTGLKLYDEIVVSGKNIYEGKVVS